MGTGGEVQIVHRHAEEIFSIGAEGAKFSHLLRTHPRVDVHLAAFAEACALYLADADDAFSNSGAGFGALGDAQFVEGDGGRLDVQIDAIEQRAGDSLAIFFHLLRRAAALAFRVAVEAAGARVPATVTGAWTAREGFADGFSRRQGLRRLILALVKYRLLRTRRSLGF